MFRLSPKSHLQWPYWLARHVCWEKKIVQLKKIQFWVKFLWSLYVPLKVFPTKDLFMFHYQFSVLEDNAALCSTIGFPYSGSFCSDIGFPYSKVLYVPLLASLTQGRYGPLYVLLIASRTQSLVYVLPISSPTWILPLCATNSFPYSQTRSLFVPLIISLTQGPFLFN